MASRNYSTLTRTRLYSLAGNTCCHPDCNERLVSTSYNISDICHIEALNEGGARYNSSSTDMERNDYPNLMLLCKNHHCIIDEKDSSGLPLYSVAQLKAMKQTHEDSFEASRSATFVIRSSSLIAKVITDLGSHLGQPRPNRASHAFKIEEKIEFNKISRHFGIIQKYSAYYNIVESIYAEFETAKRTALWESINDIYLSCMAPTRHADDIWDAVEGLLVEKVNREVKLEYSEELEWCVKIIMVDAFMRCKILEEPQL